jgi:hypothetical protein
MRSPSWSKDELLWRKVVAALAQAGEHDLVERLEQSRRPGARKKPAIAYRQLRGMWISYRRRHEGTDEKLAYGFIRTHEHQIRLLGLKIGQKIDPKKGPWASLRDGISRGKREVRNQRQLSWRIVRGSLTGSRIVADPNEALLIQAAIKAALLQEN